MENNLIHIEISANTLASLIQRGCIHGVDFRCLDIDSKKTVWKLFLSAVKLTQKNKCGYQENGHV